MGKFRVIALTAVVLISGALAYMTFGQARQAVPQPPITQARAGLPDEVVATPVQRQVAQPETVIQYVDMPAPQKRPEREGEFESRERGEYQ